MTTEKAFDNLVDFLLHYSRAYKKSPKSMKMDDGSMCALGAYYDYSIVKRGNGEWTLNPNTEDEFGKWMIHVTDQHAKFVNNFEISGDVKTRLCTLNDTTELSMPMIGEMLVTERSTFGLRHV